VNIRQVGAAGSLRRREGIAVSAGEMKIIRKTGEKLPSAEGDAHHQDAHRPLTGTGPSLGLGAR
jgi:hypothetical protein